MPLRRFTSASETINDYQHVVLEGTADAASTAEGCDGSSSIIGSARVVWPPSREASSALLPGEADTQRAFRVRVIARSACKLQQPNSPASAARPSSLALPPKLAAHHEGRQPAQSGDQGALYAEGLPEYDAGGDVVAAEQAAQAATPEGLPQAAAGPATASPADPPAAGTALIERATASGMAQDHPPGEQCLDSDQPRRASDQQQLASAVLSETSPVQRSAEPAQVALSPAIVPHAGGRQADTASSQQHCLPSDAVQAAAAAMTTATVDATGASTSVQALLCNQEPLVPASLPPPPVLPALQSGSPPQHGPTVNLQQASPTATDAEPPPVLQPLLPAAAPADGADIGDGSDLRARPSDPVVLQVLHICGLKDCGSHNVICALA